MYVTLEEDARGQNGRNKPKAFPQGGKLERLW